jgi:ribosomal protein S18 acetylase RimI-like enzyme
MHTRYVDGITIRPLRNGDTATVSALFNRLSERSRARRFCGAKPRLSDSELASLARVDEDHHVLVGFVDGDPEPVGIARIAREGQGAEIAFEVADAYQGRGIGSTLARELAADARAAGIRELVATVCSDNASAVSLVKRIAVSLHMRWAGGAQEFIVDLETQHVPRPCRRTPRPAEPSSPNLTL